MRHFLLFLIVFSMVAFGAGCAETGACPADEVPTDGDCVPVTSKIIPVGCRNSITDALSLLDWELTVSLTPVESGELFTATLEGVAVANEFFLDTGQSAIPGGVKEMNLIDLKATVHVHSGATGADVILTSEPIPYECFVGRTECDPANDDVPGVPGLRSNTDCKPEETTNPCGRFVLLPISSDCAPGGVCDGRNKTGQCSDNGFCITGDLRLPLERVSGEYTADSQGKVLFGWADESTGATIEVTPDFEDPTGPIGVRFVIGTIPVALECTMGAGTPDEALISFPIQTP